MTKKQKKTLKRIIAAAVLTVLLALLFHFVELPWFVQLVLWLVPYLVIGHDVLRKAFMGIKNGEVFDENFLMAVATVGAIGCGEYAEGVAVMLFYQIGELFQSYAVGKSRSSITALMDIRPDSANLEAEDGSVSVVDPDDVPIGATIVVKPGEKIPLDGVVLTGESTLNTAALTGESRPRTVRPGDEVISGCVNADGVLRIRTTKIYGESTVAKILDLVENSSLKKAPVENFITKFARCYTPAVCIGALVLAVVPPLLLGNWLDWIMRALTFLVISCPCALVISIPLSFFGGIGGASACGILVKGSTYLEELARTGIVVFDKTGTLTQGTFKVVGIHPENGVTGDALVPCLPDYVHTVVDHERHGIGFAVVFDNLCDIACHAGDIFRVGIFGPQLDERCAPAQRVLNHAGNRSSLAILRADHKVGAHIECIAHRCI